MAVTIKKSLQRVYQKESFADIFWQWRAVYVDVSFFIPLVLFALWLCGLDLPLIIRAIRVGRIGMVVIVLTCHTCNLGWNELRTPFWILFSTMDKVLDITDQQDSISSLTGTTPCNVATSHTKFLYYITRKPFCYSACSNFFIQLQALQHVFLELSKFEMREDSTLHHDELRTTSTGVLVYDCETWGLFGKEVIEQNLGQVLEFICHFFSSVKNWLKRVITYVFFIKICVVKAISDRISVLLWVKMSKLMDVLAPVTVSEYFKKQKHPCI